MGNLKIFQVDEANWYAASTPEEAQAAYRADAGPDADEYMEEFGVPVEMADSDAKLMRIVEVDEPGHPSKSFKEVLLEMTEPGFIASTEY